MCQYCDNTDTVQDYPTPIHQMEMNLGVLGTGRIFAELDDDLDFVIGAQFCGKLMEDAVKIHYCPMCGRKLADG